MKETFQLAWYLRTFYCCQATSTSNTLIAHIKIVLVIYLHVSSLIVCVKASFNLLHRSLSICWEWFEWLYRCSNVAITVVGKVTAPVITLWVRIFWYDSLFFSSFSVIVPVWPICHGIFDFPTRCDLVGSKRNSTLEFGFITKADDPLTLCLSRTFVPLPGFKQLVFLSPRTLILL